MFSGRVALVQAARTGSIYCVTDLLTAGADVNLTEANGDSAFHWVAYHGWMDMMTKLVEAGAKWNEVNNEGVSALERAAYAGRIDCMRYLLELYAESDKKGEVEKTMVYGAALGGHLRCLNLLIEAGAQVNCGTGDVTGLTPLMAAVMGDHVACVGALMCAGADVNAGVQPLNITALTLAAWEGRQLCLLRLLAAGANPNTITAIGFTPLFIAARLGLTKGVEALVQSGAEVNAEVKVLNSDRDAFENLVRLYQLTTKKRVDHNDIVITDAFHLADAWLKARLSQPMDLEVVHKQVNMRHKLAVFAEDGFQSTSTTSALVTAAGSGHDACVKVLLSHGAAVNQATTSGGVTPLLAAATKGRKKCVSALIDAGADVNAVDHRGFTPLLRAANVASEACVIALAEAGADANIVTNDCKHTALMLMVSTGMTNGVRALIKAGADVNLTLREEAAPLLHAIDAKAKTEDNIADIVKLLIESGAKVNATKLDKKRTPALLLAIKNKLYTVAEMLVKAGADTNGADYYEKTALMSASQQGAVHIQELLINAGANVNQQDTVGNRALVYAFSEDHMEAVKLLLNNGSEVENDFDAYLASITAKLGRAPSMSNFRPSRDLTELLHAAGHDVVSRAPRSRGRDLDLHEICRDAIRAHLMKVHPNQALLFKIPQLPLPKKLNRYLLYEVSLEGIKDATKSHGNEE